MIPLSEHAEQVAVCNWFDKTHPGIVYFAVPNGANLGGTDNQRFGQINKLKAEGLQPGCPDLIIAAARGGYHACALEMKSLKGKLSENQEQFLARLEEAGWYTIVGIGADDAIQSLTEYLSWA